MCGLATAAATGAIVVAGAVDGASDPAAVDCQPSFTATGAMTIGRASPAVATLDNGMVLMAGGDDGVMSAELYDGATRTFSKTGSPYHSRCYGCSAVRLVNGRILVVGGWDGEPVLSSAEIFSPDSSTFAPTLGSISVPRLEPSAVRLNTGHVLLIGGHNGTAIHGSAELYDPDTQSFATTANLTTPRLAPATLLADGRVLVAGGQADGDPYLQSAEIYDPLLGVFAQSSGSLVIARHGHQATRLANGRVLITGGVTRGSDGSQQVVAEAEIYDPITDTFSLTAGPMLAARANHGAVLLASGRVLVIGGSGATGVLESTELYDPTTASFSPGPNLGEPRSSAGIALLPSGEILVAGGRGASNEHLTSAEVYGCRPANHAPVAQDQVLTTNEDTAGAVTLSGADADGDPLTFTIVSGPMHGTLSGTAPNLSYTPVPHYYGPDAFTYKVSDGTDDSRPAAVTITVRARTETSLNSSATVLTYGQPMTLTATVTSSGGTPYGTVRFFDGGTELLGTGTLDSSGRATLTTSKMPAGMRSISAAYDSADYADSASSPITINVARASTTTSMTVTPLLRQYSDRVTLVATVSTASATAESPAGSVTFRVGGQEIGTAPIIAGKATLNAPLVAVPVGSRPVTATFNRVSPNFTVANVIRSMMIVKEDARAAFSFNGSTTFSTNGSPCNCAVVPLTAIVRDISATPEAAGDVDAGDIRNARVYFVNRATGAVIGPVTPTLIDPADRTTGTVSANWTMSIGSARSQTFTIGIIVDYGYTRNSTTEDTRITIVKP